MYYCKVNSSDINWPRLTLEVNKNLRREVLKYKTCSNHQERFHKVYFIDISSLLIACKSWPVNFMISK